ncbi:MAG: hypothetical protein K1000chlam3_01508 [Chlamydiae bacterium]|nr:hypothetical protein [Chlamydiota bacterium]
MNRIGKQDVQNNYFNPIQVMKKHPAITFAVVAITAAVVSWYVKKQIDNQNLVNILKDIAEKQAGGTYTDFLNSSNKLFSELNGLESKLTENKYIFNIKDGTIGLFSMDKKKLGENLDFFYNRFFLVFKTKAGNCGAISPPPGANCGFLPAIDPDSKDLFKSCSNVVSKMYENLNKYTPKKLELWNSLP